MSIENEKHIEAFLSFKLANEIYAINTKGILEVLELPKITKVPTTPNYLRGVINLRGEVIPVIDTRQLFNLKSKKDDINTVIIILTMQSQGKLIKIGTIADKVMEVFEYNTKVIQDVPEFGLSIDPKLISGLIKQQGQFTLLLNTDIAFDFENKDLFN